MQIARVKLSGFKSFVDPVELRILPGLTGIVGPNGCGKSNLLEAIRWAMGEGSARSLRGAGMDDVIFAGTATRPQRQFAEVSLLAARAGDEVEITRRIERGAGSAYRIDGRDARARDAQLLFADAATGAHSPALVSQGKIGAIIAAKPGERRALLEEAAGIAGLHVRRREAEIRLKATEANLARLGEIVTEQDARAAMLRRQARAAERYRKLSDAIKLGEGRLIYARWRNAAAAADAARAEVGDAEARVARATEAQRVSTTSLRDAAARLDEARTTNQRDRDAAGEARHRLVSAELAIAALDASLTAAAADRARLEGDLERECDLARDADEALARLAEECASLDNRIAAAVTDRERLVAEVAATEVAARDADSALAQVTALRAGRRAERQLTEAALATAQAHMSRVDAEQRRLRAEIEALPLASDLAGESLRAVAQRDRAEGARAAADATLAAVDRNRAEAFDRLADAQRQHADAAARLTALESEARALKSATPAIGALASVTARPGFEAALAAALADDLAAEIGMHASASRRWTGSDVHKDDPLLPTGVALSDLVDAPDELRRRLRQIAVVDVDEGTTLAVGQRLVTRSGHLRRWDGFVSDGAGGAAADQLIRDNRLTALRPLLADAKLLAEGARGGLNEAAQALSAVERALVAARTARDGADGALRAALRLVDSTTAAAQRIDAEHTRITARLDEVSHEGVTVGAALTDARARQARLPGDDLGAGDEPAAARSRAARDAVSAARSKLIALDAARDLARHRRAAAQAEDEAWRARSRTAAKRGESLAQRAATLDIEAQALAGKPTALQVEVAQARAAVAAAEAATDDGAARAADAEATLRQRERDHAQIGETLTQAREDRAGAAARAENQELRRVEMGRVSSERFECSPPLLPEKLGFAAAEVTDPQSASRALEALTLDRDRMGPVNLVAEAELAEIEAARDGNSAEMGELVEATHRLRGSIGSLNREGRTKLRAAFDAVDGHFRALFRTLFDGGEARLELIDSDDPLDAGLEILAQPPGKKLASLTLLSGGEQALTAVALIFALFLTNPAPLCVLDEVDAPLDDANVERFCDLLDAMAHDTATRYLIVTHNAVTMARMHRLYGVTMIEQGVSKLVSVDLGSAEALLAAE